MSKHSKIDGFVVCTRQLRKVFAVIATLTISVNIFSPAVLSAAISQGYLANGNVPAGALVALEPAKGDVVEADIANGNNLLGVATSTKGAALSINSNGSSSVQVATSGAAKVFVSDINGPIKAGDQIAPSPIEGVGMKATGDGKVVGIAQSDYTGAKPLKTVTLSADNGATKQAHVGIISVAVQVAYYSAPSNTLVPVYLQQFAQSVTGKAVSVAQLAVATTILGVGIIVVALLMFASVRGAVVSIGRNPLAKSSIYRSMFQATATSAVILAAAVAGSYMVLRY